MLPTRSPLSETPPATADEPPPRAPLLSRERVLPLLAQIVVVAAVITGGTVLFTTTQANLDQRHIESGFRFLGHEAGFTIGYSLIPYQPTDSYGRAFLVGIINTSLVSVLSIFLATALGIAAGVAQVSRNWLIARLGEIYVEVLRNVPLLLTLIFMYTVVLAGLPPVRRSLDILGVAQLNQRGLFLPRPLFGDGFGLVAAVFGLAVAATAGFMWWSRRHHERTGVAVPALRLGLVGIVLATLAAHALAGFPLDWEPPVLKGLNFAGGVVCRPEFAALLIGLVVYRGAFIAENVRAGILAVEKGQREAAAALGLTPGRTMRLIVLPQALRTIIPSTTNDYVSLIKDSSLAVAIGYPDMVSVGGTMIGQNGQAIEVIGMWMAIYLTINLIVSLLMNWANLKAQLVGRQA